MPFDGIVTKSVAQELNGLLAGGRIEKVHMPEQDELVLNVRAGGKSFKLLMCAGGNYPRIHITGTANENPSTPPGFCMFLRKHISGSRIIEVMSHDYERIVTLLIESVSELGDLVVKKLLIEVMGKYSNIILLNSDDRILDAMKHIDADISSKREVMPARRYSPPPPQDKISPDGTNANALIDRIGNIDSTNGLNDINDIHDFSIEKYLLDNIKGFSPLICREICLRSGIDPKIGISSIRGDRLSNLKSNLSAVIQDIRNSCFSPCVIYGDTAMTSVKDYYCLGITCIGYAKPADSMNEAMDRFYSEKDGMERLKQKRSDIMKVLANGLDRCRRKKALQEESLRSVADREKLRLFGELLTANIYRISPGRKSVVLEDYYSDNAEQVEIALDENISPQQNAQRYFKKYAKAKSTYANTERQLKETNTEQAYLESVLQHLENSMSLKEIDEIRQELAEQGYMARQRQPGRKKPAKTRDKPSAPLHYMSSDGFDIYVGKNNRQNDHLTMKTASPPDLWLHTRNIPGSHVIVRKGRREIPDSSLYEAALIAAYYSGARNSSGVPVDYTLVKHVKKPSGSKPGMVIYENFKTVTVTPDAEKIAKIKKSE